MKCLYFYKYGVSSCNVTNASSYLTIMYDGTGDVVYNNMKYTPTSIKIFKPSLHTFNGAAAEGEMLIEHTSAQGGFIVCVPISVGPVGTGGQLLQTIIEDAPTVSDGTITLNLANFTASAFIPKSAYFTYTGTVPYKTTCDQTFNILVFPRLASINISSDVMTTLGKTITYSYINTVEGDCFYNEKGTNLNGFASDNQIYIDCQPVGASEETVVVTDSSSDKSTSTKDASEVVNAILMTLFIVVAIGALMYFIRLGTGQAKEGRDPLMGVIGLIVLSIVVKLVEKKIS
jgi:hypothetical protein